MDPFFSFVHLTVVLVGRHSAMKVHFSRMYLARYSWEEGPSGDPNTRQQHPPILTHQDIHVRDAGRQEQEATRACHLAHTNEQVYVYQPSIEIP